MSPSQVKLNWAELTYLDGVLPACRVGDWFKTQLAGERGGPKPKCNNMTVPNAKYTAHRDDKGNNYPLITYVAIIVFFFLIYVIE